MASSSIVSHAGALTLAAVPPHLLEGIFVIGVFPFASRALRSTSPESPHKMDHKEGNNLRGTIPWAKSTCPSVGQWIRPWAVSRAGTITDPLHLRRHRRDNPRNHDASTRDPPPRWRSRAGSSAPDPSPVSSTHKRASREKLGGTEPSWVGRGSAGRAIPSRSRCGPPRTEMPPQGLFTRPLAADPSKFPADVHHHRKLTAVGFS